MAPKPPAQAEPAGGTEAATPAENPTIAEWLAAGYLPSAYVSAGYTKSPQHQVDVLVAMEKAGATKDELIAAAGVPGPDGDPTKGAVQATEITAPPTVRHGTSEAADAVLSQMPDSPTQRGAKIVDRPFTSGASG